MSSMRNAVQRRNHRERAQPVEREKWGVLEKHKDYSLRAKDYNEKKKRLQILRQKAAERNPDEFRFGMTSSKTDGKGQKLVERGNPKLSQDAVKLLKTQDVGYLRIMLQKTRRARDRIEQDYVQQGGMNTDVLGHESDRSHHQHTLFAEGIRHQHLPASQTAIRSKLVKLEDNGQTQFSKTKKTSDCDDANKQDILSKEDRILRRQHKRSQEIRSSKLKLLKLREGDLLAALQELELQRAKMNNNVGGTTRAGAKWKIRERKK